MVPGGAVARPGHGAGADPVTRRAGAAAFAAAAQLCRTRGGGRDDRRDSHLQPGHLRYRGPEGRQVALSLGERLAHQNARRRHRTCAAVQERRARGGEPDRRERTGAAQHTLSVRREPAPGGVPRRRGRHRRGDARHLDAGAGHQRQPLGRRQFERHQAAGIQPAGQRHRRELRTLQQRRSLRQRIPDLQRPGFRGLDVAELQPGAQQRRQTPGGNGCPTFLRAGHTLGGRRHCRQGRPHRSGLQRRQRGEPVPPQAEPGRGVRRLVAGPDRRLGAALFHRCELAERRLCTRARAGCTGAAAAGRKAGGAVLSLRADRGPLRKAAEPQPDRAPGILCARPGHDAAAGPGGHRPGFEPRCVALRRLGVARLRAGARTHADRLGRDFRPVHRRAGASPTPRWPGPVLLAAEPALAVLCGGVGRHAHPFRPGRCLAAGR